MVSMKDLVWEHEDALHLCSVIPCIEWGTWRAPVLMETKEKPFIMNEILLCEKHYREYVEPEEETECLLHGQIGGVGGDCPLC